jgi:hypothetical protein
MVDLFEPQAIVSRHTQDAPVNVSAIARDLGLSVYLTVKCLLTWPVRLYAWTPGVLLDIRFI